ncbi:MAG: hypothetical protein ACLRYD_04195 [Ruminococcus callidus]
MILDEIMKYRARQLEREKAACGLEKCRSVRKRHWRSESRFL